MSATNLCESNSDGYVMPSMVFPSRPAENGFISNDSHLQMDSVGLDGLMAMNQTESTTCYRDPRNVEVWAVASANPQASVMNIYDAGHVNPMDTSNNMADSYPFGAHMTQEDPFATSTQCRASKHVTQLQNMDSVFGQGSPHCSEFSIGGTRSHEDARSDAPSLEWGPSVCSNSSADGSQSSHFQLEIPHVADGFHGSDLLEDARSSHFQLDVPSPMNAVSSPDLFEGPPSWCSPSAHSVEFTIGDYSPALMPLSGATETSCGPTAHLLSFDGAFGDDFMSQFTNEGQSYVQDTSYLSSDMSTGAPLGQDQCSEDLYSPVDGSIESGFPYPGATSAKTFAARRWNADADGIGARSSHLYHVTAGPDGLFHCPFVNSPEGCRHRADKLKCNYDKHLDSHLKPYRCNEPDPECEGKQFSSTACLLRHQRERHAMHGHGDRPFMCRYEGCERAQSGNGFPRHWNLNDHMKRVHNHVVDGLSKAPKGRKGSESAAPTRTRIQRRSRTMSG